MEKTRNLQLVEETLTGQGISYQLHEVDPNKLDIDSTVKKLGIKYSQGLSTLLYKVRANEFIAVLRRDDTLFNLDKLKKHVGTSRVSFAGEDDVRNLGFEPGLATPILLSAEREISIKVYVDREVTEMERVFCGSGSPMFALEVAKDDMLSTVKDYEVIDISYPNPQRQDLEFAVPAVEFKGRVITDEKLIARFLSWSVDKILPDKDGLAKKLYSGERITAYMGFDPTGPYLHVGHAMGVRALRILQQLGHRVIFLVGDYTARVGDPDKDTTRKLLTEAEIAENMAGWKDQVAGLIDFDDAVNPVEFKHNFEWLSKLKLEDLVRLMSKMTVQQMLERDLFQKRLGENKPLQLQELIYPLMQGFDSVAMGVDVELGGTDQIFNMMVGRDLVKAYLGKEKYVRAHRMMPAPEGITMSKTRGNGINLSDSAHDMYGKAMSYADEHIITGLELLTDTSEDELEQIAAAIKTGENPMQFKKLMAERIVTLVKGKGAAAEAEKYFESTVQNREISSERTKISLAKVVKRLEHIGKLGDPVTTLAELMETSKGQIKQLLRQGGVELNGEKLTEASELKLQLGDILKVGKRNWFEVVD